MSEQAQRILLWCAAVLIVVGTAVALRFAQGYRTVAGIPAIGELLPPNVTLRLEHLTVRGRKDNRPAWTIKADRLDSTKLRDRMDFTGNIGAALIHDGATRATLTAATASYVDPPKILTVSGGINAVLRGDKNDARPDVRFETEQVIWNVGTKTVDCPGKAKLTYGDNYVEGEQLKIDLTTRDYSMRETTGLVIFDETSDSMQSALPSLQGLAP